MRIGLIFSSLAVAIPGLVARRRHTLRIARLATLLSIVALHALTRPVLQAQTHSLPDGAAVGGSVDRFIHSSGGPTAVSFRYSALRRNSVGTELGVSLFPQALQAPVLLLAPDFGPAFNVSLPRSTLLLKAGASAIMGLGQGGAELIPGLHVGAGLIVHAEKRLGFRLDVIRRYYRIDSETEALWSIGLGFAVLRPQRILTP
jgi:hypothetical protein